MIATIYVPTMVLAAVIVALLAALTTAAPAPVVIMLPTVLQATTMQLPTPAMTTAAVATTAAAAATTAAAAIQALKLLPVKAPMCLHTIELTRTQLTVLSAKQMVTPQNNQIRLRLIHLAVATVAAAIADLDVVGG